LSDGPAELPAAGSAAAFACEGAPRDLGRRQGSLCAAELQRAFRAAPLAQRLAVRLPQRRSAARLARDLWRHFPHQAERLQALARAAGVPEAWLWRGLAEELRGSAAPDALALVAVGALPQIVGWFSTPLRLRESRPDGRHASLEWCAAGASAARIGVNERGLAAAALALVGAGQLDPGHPRAESAPGAPRCAAPATLLVQDCLENFDRLEPAVDWCLARPAAGMARILLADAQGRAAAVDLALGERSLRGFEGEALLAARRAEDGEEIGKLLVARAAATASDAAACERWLARLLAGGSARHAGVVDPAGRRAGWLEPSGRLGWRSLAPAPEAGEIH